MIVRSRCLLAMQAGVMATVVCLSPLIVHADEPMASPTIGTQTVGLAVGPFFPIRLLPSQSSKLFGTAAVASWSMTLTDPIGSSWYRGQIALGAELLEFGTPSRRQRMESEPHRNCNIPSSASIACGPSLKAAEDWWPRA